MRLVRTLTFVFVVLFIWASAVQATTPVQSAPVRNISMDFKNINIHVLIKFISELTGRNFIVDSRVKGNITAYSPSKLSVEEAYKAFESILLVNNFAVVGTKINNEYKIVPAIEARVMGVPVDTGTFVHPELGEALITQIIPLKNSSAPELAKLLAQLVDKNGLISVYTPTNTLIVTAPATNVESILAIVQEVDRGAYATQLRTFPLEYGDAEDIASSIKQIMIAKIQELEKIGKKAMAFVEPVSRTNSIVALADPDSLGIIADMIESLDIPTPQGKDDIHFVSLENADAEEVATILNDLISRQVNQEGVAGKLSKDIKLVSDKATNSLIITARPDEFETLLTAIRKLDVLRTQVYIEALIMEVSADSNVSFGVNWATAGSGNDTSAFAAVNAGGGAIILPDDSDRGSVGFPSGGSIGAILNDAINIGTVSYSIQSILNIARTSNDYRILATPQLLTLDNETASIKVVDNIPFATQTETSNINSDYSSQSIDYKDVGVQLEITPHIGERGTLRLEVKQEVSRVVDSFVTISDSQRIIAPTTKKREVATVIQMQDNQTAVIAGLINDDSSEGEAKVPGLGDMPMLGWLFKEEEKTIVQTNLFIFITPKIINSYKGVKALATSKESLMHDVDVGSSGRGLPKMVMSDHVLPVFVPMGPTELQVEDMAQ